MKPQTNTNVLCAFTLIELLVVMASAAEFHPPIVIESPAPEREGWFGVPSGVPDVNGDGRPEILICAGGGARSAYLFDGVTRQLLHEFTGNGGFGIDDVNGDGRGDVVVGGGAGIISVLDGKTGGVIHSLEPVVTPNTEVRDVSAVRDVNGDGRPDIAIGTINFSGGAEVIQALLRSMAERAV